MQEEKDLIQREVKRLSMALSKMIAKALGLKSNDVEQDIEAIEIDLKKAFDFNLEDILQLDQDAFINTLHGLHEEHLEKLAELITIVLNNTTIHSKRALAERGLIILNVIDDRSKTFSLGRLQLKRALEQWS